MSGTFTSTAERSGAQSPIGAAGKAKGQPLGRIGRQGGLHVFAVTCFSYLSFIAVTSSENRDQIVSTFTLTSVLLRLLRHGLRMLFATGIRFQDSVELKTYGLTGKTAWGAGVER